MNIIFICCI